jgi:hypothetical protein
MKNIYLTLIAALFLFVTPLIAYALPDEEGGGPGERYFFTLSGEIHGISSGSPLSAYISNGDAFSVAGYFYSDGRLNLTQLKIMPDDLAGGGGGIVAMPDEGA